MIIWADLGQSGSASWRLYYKNIPHILHDKQQSRATFSGYPASLFKNALFGAQPLLQKIFLFF